ncbi:hypothetical protein ACFWPH_13010 [Nocardia sp. NPDC058499]
MRATASADFAEGVAAYTVAHGAFVGEVGYLPVMSVDLRGGAPP